jgi:hypothetical protein
MKREIKRIQRRNKLIEAEVSCSAVSQIIWTGLNVCNDILYFIHHVKNFIWLYPLSSNLPDN